MIGKGTNRNQIARITRQIDNDLFAGIAVAVNVAIDEVLNKISTELQRVQDQMTKTLWDDFRSAGSQPPPWSEALDKACNALKVLTSENLAEMQEIEDGLKELGIGTEVAGGIEEP